MALEKVANEDLKVSFSIVSSDPSDAVYTGDPGIDLTKVVPTLDAFAKANNKKVATTSIVITWTLGTGGCPYTSALYNFVSGSAVIFPSAVKTKASNNLVLRETDTGANCAGSWTLKVPPFTAVNCSCDIEISDAGQNEVKAE